MKDFDEQLEDFINKKPLYDPRDLLVRKNVKRSLAGLYYGKANNITKKIAKKRGYKNPEGCCYLFMMWEACPQRIFKHYGLKSKYDDWIMLRGMDDKEIEYCEGSNRMIRKMFFNWNDLIVYHLRLNFPVGGILHLDRFYPLDRQPIDYDLCRKVARTNPNSKFHFNPALGQQTIIL